VILILTGYELKRGGSMWLCCRTEKSTSVDSGSLTKKVTVQKLLGGIWWHGSRGHKILEFYRTFHGGITFLLNYTNWNETMILIIQRD